MAGMQSKWWLVASLALACAVGCGGGGDEFGRDMAPVSGKVTVKGQPIKADKNVFVVFEKVGQRPESIEVKSDGTYEGKAPIGENSVGLQVYGPPSELGPINPEYTKGSPLKVTVEAGKVIDLEVGQ